MSAITTTNNENLKMNLASMKKLMLHVKVGNDNKIVWTTTLESFGMADGKTKKSDIMVDELEQGLSHYVTELEHKDAKSACWDLMPLDQFKKVTKDDFFCGIS